MRNKHGKRATVEGKKIRQLNREKGCFFLWQQNENGLSNKLNVFEAFLFWLPILCLSHLFFCSFFSNTRTLFLGSHLISRLEKKNSNIPLVHFLFILIMMFAVFILDVLIFRMGKFRIPAENGNASHINATHAYPRQTWWTRMNYTSSDFIAFFLLGPQTWKIKQSQTFTEEKACCHIAPVEIMKRIKMKRESETNFFLFLLFTFE